MIDPSDAIAGYAALLSSILAVREYYKTRPRIKARYFQTGEPGTDDVITLYNDTARNIVILHFELVKGRRNMLGQFQQKTEIETGCEGQYINIPIAPHNSFQLTITDQFKFSFSGSNHVFISLYLAGRSRPIRLKL